MNSHNSEACRMEEQMKIGYQEMAQINLIYAEECISPDEEQMNNYEKFLKELD